MSQTAKHIQDQIQEAKEKESKSLSLHRQQLTQIPTEVFELEHLEELDLRYNQITIVPPEIKALKSLKKIDLRYNPQATKSYWMPWLKNTPIVPTPAKNCTT